MIISISFHFVFCTYFILDFFSRNLRIFFNYNRIYVHFQRAPNCLANNILSIGIATLTLAYASVPLYRAICQRTGYGGTPITDQTRFTAEKLIPQEHAKRIRVTFNASVSDVLEWKFTPQQREVRVLPGETALAFYKAKNMSKEDIIGVATYSVTPGQVAPYFSKIQCFCFEGSFLPIFAFLANVLMIGFGIE